jgi:hypothetical protein
MWRVIPTALASALILSFSAPLYAQAEEAASVAPPVIEFHSGFWLNLHHFLYLEARLHSSAEPVARNAEAQPEYAAALPAGDLTPAEQTAWNAALGTYTKDWAARSLLQNGDMVIVNDRLAELEDCTDISAQATPACAAGLRADMVSALTQAAPVYRAHWWAEQDRENRAWIAGVTPLIHEMGSDMANRLVRVFRHPWPSGRLRVDVVWYAGAEGSYTTLMPPHITIASHDSRNQGLAAFEILFHEASHTLAEGVNEAIERRCRELGKPIPRDLWNALLFYTTGELVRREVANSPALAAASGAAAVYTPYAIRNGLYDHGWNDYEVALEKFWQDYLDGNLSFDTAIERIVGSI